MAQVLIFVLKFPFSNFRMSTLSLINAKLKTSVLKFQTMTAPEEKQKCISGRQKSTCEGVSRRSKYEVSN